MWKKFGLGLILTGAPFMASADWQAGVGLVKFKNIEPYGSVGALTLSSGYEFDLGDRFKLVPNIRVGYGILEGSETPSETTIQNDDGFFSAEQELSSEINHFYSVGLTTKWRFDNGIYTFATPSYTSLDIVQPGHYYIAALDESSTPYSYSVGEAYDGLSLEFGVGYAFNKTFRLELGYEFYFLDFSEQPESLALQVKLNF